MAATSGMFASRLDPSPTTSDHREPHQQQLDPEPGVELLDSAWITPVLLNASTRQNMHSRKSSVFQSIPFITVDRLDPRAVDDQQPERGGDHRHPRRHDVGRQVLPEHEEDDHGGQHQQREGGHDRARERLRLQVGRQRAPDVPDVLEDERA